MAPIVSGLTSVLNNSCTPKQARAALAGLNAALDAGGVEEIRGTTKGSQYAKPVVAYVDRGDKPTVVYDLKTRRAQITTVAKFRRAHKAYNLEE